MPNSNQVHSSGPSASPSVWGALKGILGEKPSSAGNLDAQLLSQHVEQNPHRLQGGQLRSSGGEMPLAEQLEARMRSPLLSGQGQASQHHYDPPAAQHQENGGAGDGQDGEGGDNWNSFVHSWMKEDGDDNDSPQGPPQPHLGPPQSATLGPRQSVKSAKSGKSAGFVAELEEQAAADAMAEQLRLLGAPEPADLTKQPKKSALKGGGGGGTFRIDASGTAPGLLAANKDAKDKGSKTSKNPGEVFKIVMPSLATNGWEALVHQVVWKLARHFGFQAFNANPKTRDLAVQEYVAASAILAGDHLSQLLCKCGYVRRGVTWDPDEERFAKALHELHATIFHTYEHSWCKLVGLPWRTTVAQKVLRDYSYCDPRVMHGLLAELGLWFLIYTESSSLRHTPELMWFIYWCMSTSFIMADFWHRELPEIEPNMRDRRIELRNLHQKLIGEIQNQLQIYPRRTRPEDCGRMSTIISRLRDTEVPDEDFNLLGDLVAFGDGGFYMDRIVNPIFDVFAYEIDHLSNLGVDVAHRIGYDDFNESMCVREIIHDTLRELRVKPEQIVQATHNDAYVSLTNLGFGKGAAMSTFEVPVASEFWHSKVFVKTYRERRTWAAVYRAYFRVWCVHLIAYQFLQVLAFTGWDWRMLSSCIVTHAVLKAFERFCNWFMTNEPPEPLNTTLSKVFTTKGRYGMSQAGKRAIERMHKVVQSDNGTARNATEFIGAGLHKIRRRRHHVEGKPLYGVFGFLEWIVLAIVVFAWYVIQFTHSPLRQHARNWWAVLAASWLMLHAIHWVLTLRDGYMVSLTHMLKMPSIFKASSPRPDATCWISEPMHMKWKLLWLNALFWFCVFAMKLPFDYYVICKPVVEPLQIVTQRHYLQCQGKWYLNGVFPCIGADWLLLAGRVCPFLVIIFMDTSLFYQITITMFGIIRGLFALDLGVLTSWDEVVKEFYRAPARWWHKCMSEMGNDNQLSQLKQSMYIEDGTTGGHTQVTDGMMFKKSVLTPEEIHGKKVHFNGRNKSGGGNNSEPGMATKRADSVVGTDDSRANLLGKMAGFMGGSDKKAAGGALLPSSTNRTKTAGAGVDFAAKKKKEDERAKEQAAKVSAKRAAIAAGLDHVSDPSTYAGTLNAPGDANASTLQKLMTRNATLKQQAGEEALAKPGSAKPGSAQGVKSMFNKLMSSKPEMDEVDKMAADAKRNVQMRKLASTTPGLGPAPSMKGVQLNVQQAAKSKQPGATTDMPTVGEDEEDNDEFNAGGGANSSTALLGPGDKKPPAGPGVMNRLTTLLRGGGAGEDDVDKMTRGARLAAKSVKENRAAAGAPRPGVQMELPGVKTRPVSALPAALAAAQASRPGSAGTVASGSSSAVSPSKKKKSGSKKGGIKFADDEPSLSPRAQERADEEEDAAFFSARPVAGESSSSRQAFGAPADEMEEAEESYSPTLMPNKVPGSSSGGPVAESTTTEGGSSSAVRRAPEISAASGDESGADVTSPQRLSGTVGRPSWAKRGVAVAPLPAGPGPVAEGAEDEGMLSEESSFTSSSSGSHHHHHGSPAGDRDDPRIPASRSHRHAVPPVRPPMSTFMHPALTSLGPAMSWWSVFGQQQQEPQRSLLSTNNNNNVTQTPVTGMDGSEDYYDASREVRIRVARSGDYSPSATTAATAASSGPGPIAEGAEGSFSRPGPVGEGAQTDLASWLNSSGAGAAAGAPGRASTAGAGLSAQPSMVVVAGGSVVPLPDIHLGGHHSPMTSMGGASERMPDPRGNLSPLGRNPAKPLETELDEVFGRPIESRRGSRRNSEDDDDEEGEESYPPLRAGGGDEYRSLPHAIPSRDPSQVGDMSPLGRKKGVMFHGASSDLESGGGDSPIGAYKGAPMKSAVKKSPVKSARFHDSSNGHDVEDGGGNNMFKGSMVPSLGTGMSKDKASASGRDVLDDDEPLLGRFMSKFNLWKKKDQELANPSRSAKSNTRLPSMAVMKGPPPDGDGDTVKTGLTAEDLEVDDVHYQMMMWNAFANAWDEVVDDVRRSDLISDKEVGMLKFVRLDLGSRLYGLRPILLPTFFYAGQIRKVVDTGQVSTAQIMVLNELRVLSVWMGCQIGLLSGKHAHVITSAPFYAANINVKHALHRKKFYSAGVKLIDCLEEMCSRQEVPFDMREFAEHLFVMFTSIEAECFAISKAHQNKRCTDDELELSSILLEVVQEMKKEISKDADQLKVIFKNALSTSATANFKELLRVVRVIKRMLVATVAEATPTGEESQRALGFFINSLSHPSLDRPTSLDKMWSWSIMTPLYEEDVLYPLEGASLAKEMGLKKKKLTDLLTEGDDSISLMSFLKSTFPDEWNNFKERMKVQNPDIDVKELSELDFAPGAWLYDYRMELQLWASCRGQLLGRTVNGMMRNEAALRVLAKLEHPKPPSMSDLEYYRWIDQLVMSKFEMVITPQTYGKNRDSKDVRLKWLSKSIDLLLQRYPKCLKAAFLEKAEVDSMGITEFSVCIKGRDPDDLNQLPHLEDQPVFEVYRVRLPQNKYSVRGVIIGEGKPENQNHATIFAHGEGIQAIDMNQDGYLCEWLKFRNLLAELQPSSKGDFYLFANNDEQFTINASLTGAEVMCIIRFRMTGCVQTALVGFREYIFSEAAGALGRFAAATEYAFGTISQRTMTHPARVRLHYGHPDLFNKLFVMTKGGISKATRLLHLTEDVFCGCNHTLRGARIRYKEYISCGKGRDMGFDSINGFNFKIAGGGGEWAISRESYRMGTRLDFFRLMAFYHAAVGFYINSWFTYLAVYLNVYALLLYAWAQATEIQADSVQKVYNVQQVLQLGTLALIPYAGQLMLENGVIKTCLTLFQQIATGSLLFYTFQQQTVASSFATDMAYGSGKYVGTGRGFNIQSLEFVKIFTLYARSHLYMGFELLFALSTLYIVKDCASCNYGALTWSSWLLAVTLLFSPLWFNPFSFDMPKVSNNYLCWRRWMDGDVDQTTGSNWYTWNTVQLEKIRNDGGNNTDEWLNIIGTFLSTAPYVLMALGSASRIEICLEPLWRNADGEYQGMCNRYVIFMIATAAIWMLVYVTIVLRHRWLDLAQHKPWRIYTWVMSFGMIIFVAGFLVAVQRVMHGKAIDVLFLVIYSNFNILIAFHKVVTPWFSQNNAMRAFTDWFFYTVDTLVGYIMFILMALLSFIGIVGVLQMKLLFNDTFSEQVKHAKIGRAMKEQKVGFDASKGAQQNVAPGSAGGARPATAASAASGATAFTMRSLVQSEHRYM